MITVHPWLSGRPARVDALEELLAPVVEDTELWCPTAGEIATHHTGGRKVSLAKLRRPFHD
jgi:hypothetical protein